MAVLLLNIKGAFPHITKRNRMKTLKDIRVEADLVRSVEGLMKER